MLSLQQSGAALLEDLEWRAAHRGELIGIGSGFQSIDDLTNGWQPAGLCWGRVSNGSSKFAPVRMKHWPGCALLMIWSRMVC